jgi:26S proteasome regulatory subunit N9
VTDVGWRSLDQDQAERQVFVQALADKVNAPASQDAYVFATVEVASIQLSLDQQKESRKKLDECEKILDGFDSVETIVHAAFYKANAAYYKVFYPRPLTAV